MRRSPLLYKALTNTIWGRYKIQLIWNKSETNSNTCLKYVEYKMNIYNIWDIEHIDYNSYESSYNTYLVRDRLDNSQLSI